MNVGESIESFVKSPMIFRLLFFLKPLLMLSLFSIKVSAAAHKPHPKNLFSVYQYIWKKVLA